MIRGACCAMLAGQVCEEQQGGGGAAGSREAHLRGAVLLGPAAGELGTCSCHGEAVPQAEHSEGENQLTMCMFVIKGEEGLMPSLGTERNKAMTLR